MLRFNASLIECRLQGVKGCVAQPLVAGQAPSALQPGAIACRVSAQAAQRWPWSLSAPTVFPWLMLFLLPLHLLPAAEVFNRPEPVGAFNTLLTATDEMVCPPGTFLRSWDGRYDAGGLYALGLSCSDGTFIGSLGTWGFGDEDFVESTTFDGYTAIAAGLDSNGFVNAVSFISRDEEGVQSLVYGAMSNTTVTTSCREDERIVGLAARSATETGNVGAFGLLCGKVNGE